MPMIKQPLKTVFSILLLFLRAKQVNEKIIEGNQELPEFKLVIIVVV